MADETPEEFRRYRQHELGLDRGRALREEGIRRAEVRVNREIPKWSDQAVEAAKRWILARDFTPFFIHELREALYADGLPEAPELRVWGGIPRRLAKLGLIRHAGIHYSDLPEQHMAHKAKWVRA